MPKATVVYIIDPQTQQVLLAKKRRKIGIGKWFGYGGKFESEDLNDPISCTIREVDKETNGVVKLYPKNLELVGVMNFYSGFWSILRNPFKVLCYRALQPIEEIPPTTEEMEDPRLFKIAHLPLSEMLVGDRLIVPQILCGIPITGHIWYTKGQKKIIRSKIHSCTIADLHRLAV